MQWRFFTAQSTIDYDTLATALSDHEADVGIEEFGRTFNSIHPQDIKTRGQALALVKLLDLEGSVSIERQVEHGHARAYRDSA